MCICTGDLFPLAGQNVQRSKQRERRMHEHCWYVLHPCLHVPEWKRLGGHSCSSTFLFPPSTPLSGKRKCFCYWNSKTNIRPLLLQEKRKTLTKDSNDKRAPALFWFCFTSLRLFLNPLCEFLSVSSSFSLPFHFGAVRTLSMLRNRSTTAKVFYFFNSCCSFNKKYHNVTCWMSCTFQNLRY